MNLFNYIFYVLLLKYFYNSEIYFSYDNDNKTIYKNDNNHKIYIEFDNFYFSLKSNNNNFYLKYQNIAINNNDMNFEYLYHFKTDNKIIILNNKLKYNSFIIDLDDKNKNKIKEFYYLYDNYKLDSFYIFKNYEDNKYLIYNIDDKRIVYDDSEIILFENTNIPIYI